MRGRSPKRAVRERARVAVNKPLCAVLGQRKDALRWSSVGGALMRGITNLKYVLQQHPSRVHV